MNSLHNEKEHYFNLEYARLTATLVEHYDETQPENIEGLIEQIKILEKFSVNRKLFVLFSHTKFYPLYISGSINRIGYTREDILNISLREAFKLVYWKQVFLGAKVHVWGMRFRKLSKHIPIINHQIFYCGVKFKNKQGDLLTAFVKQKFVSGNKKGSPLLSFCEFVDISPHFKADFCWCRSTAGVDLADTPEITRVFMTHGRKKEYPDLLSERELAILKLVFLHKTSSEIAELLAISVETVKKHRKNMIARVGAKDMTSLIYICQLANLI